MKTVVLCLLVAAALAAPSRKPTFRRGLNRIVGGQTATPGQFPYQLSLQDICYDFGSHLCGASIYSENHAISTAGCVEELLEEVDTLQVMAGEHNLYDLDGHEQKVTVSQIILHEDYDGFRNDISVIYLSQPLKFNERVQPVPLQNERDYVGNCVVSGWGTTRFGGSGSFTLQYVDIPAITDEMCHFHIGFVIIDHSMICTKVREGGKSTCVGDNGGPLVCDGFLTGIVSLGLGCSLPQIPGVYTEVAYFRDWIKQNTK